MNESFSYYKVEKHKNICHLQRKACNTLVNKQLERCRYLWQIGCRYFICNTLYNQRKSLDSFVQSYGIIGGDSMEKWWCLYGETTVSLRRNCSVPPQKLSFPAVETVISNAGNDSSPPGNGKLMYTINFCPPGEFVLYWIQLTTSLVIPKLVYSIFFKT